MLIEQSQFFISASQRRDSNETGIYELESLREIQSFHLIREIILQYAEFRSIRAFLLRSNNHLLLLLQASFLESNRADHTTVSREWMDT